MRIRKHGLAISYNHTDNFSQSETMKVQYQGWNWEQQRKQCYPHTRLNNQWMITILTFNSLDIAGAAWKSTLARSANCTHQLETSDWWYTHVHTEGVGIYVPTETDYCHHQTKHERNRSNYVRDSVIPLYRRGVIISQTHSVSWKGQPIPSLHPLAFVSHETQWEMLHTYSEYV